MKFFYKSGRFSGRPSMSPFLEILFSVVIETWTKLWWISWERFFWNCTDSWYKNILVSVIFDLEILYLNMVNIVFILVVWSPITTLRFNKVTIFKSFIQNLLKANIKFEGTWWDGIGRVTWTIINWSHLIYNGTVRKST